MHARVSSHGNWPNSEPPFETRSGVGAPFKFKRAGKSSPAASKMENLAIKRQDELVELGQRQQVRVGKRHKVSQQRHRRAKFLGEKNVGAVADRERHQSHLSTGRHSVMSASSSSEELDERLTGQLEWSAASEEEEEEVEQGRPAAGDTRWLSGGGRATAAALQLGIAHGGWQAASGELADSMSTCGGGARASRRGTSFEPGALAEQAQVDFCFHARGAPPPPAGQESDPARGLVEQRAASPGSLRPSSRPAPTSAAFARRVTQQPGERASVEGRAVCGPAGRQAHLARLGAGGERADEGAASAQPATGDIELEQAGRRRASDSATGGRAGDEAAAATPSWSANGIDHHHQAREWRYIRTASATGRQAARAEAPREHRRDAIGEQEAATSPSSEFYSPSEKRPARTTKGVQQQARERPDQEAKKEEASERTETEEEELAAGVLEAEIEDAIECWSDECGRRGAIASATTTTEPSEATIGRDENGQRARSVLSERARQQHGHSSERRTPPPMTSTMGQPAAAGQQLLHSARFEPENHTIGRPAGAKPTSDADDQSMPPTQQHQPQAAADHECEQAQPQAQHQQPLQRQYPPNHPLGNSKHLCSICGDRATGKHYGVYSCEGCKGFFKRTIRKDIVYVCRSQGACLIDMRQRNRCQYCRYQKCLQRGMKREAVQEEKQRLKLRAAQAGAGLSASSNANCNGSASAGPHHHYATNNYLAALDNNNNNNNNAGRQQAPVLSDANSAKRASRCDTNAGQHGAEPHFARVESTTGSSMFGPTAAANQLQAGPAQAQAFSPYLQTSTQTGQEQQQHQSARQHHFNHQPNEAAQASQSPEPLGRDAGQKRLSFGPQTAMIDPLALPCSAGQPQYSQFQHNQQLHSTTIQHHRNSNHFRLASDTREARAPVQRIDELTLKWAAQVQIERLLDWAKSVPKFTELLVDDQVTLLKASWNELLIVEIAFMSAECLRDGSLPRGRSRRSSSGTPSPPGGRQQLRQHVDALCIGRGLFVTEQQAHELGLGPMFERIVNELVCKMADMRLDAHELACLREIILFNPETYGLKTSQPIEEYRGNIYTYLELYCRKQHEREPNRFGKLLLRLPVLRSIGLKCQVGRLCANAPADLAASNGGANFHLHYTGGGAELPNNLGSPASSGASSVNSNCSSQLSASSGHSSQLVSTTTGSPLAGSRAAPNGAHQAGLLFFELVYECAPVDAFLRSTLSTH